MEYELMTKLNKLSGCPSETYILTLTKMLLSISIITLSLKRVRMGKIIPRCKF